VPFSIHTKINFTTQVEGQNVKNKILKIFQFSRKTNQSLLSNICTPTGSCNQTCGHIIFFCKGCNLELPGTKGCQLSQISKYQNIIPNIYLKVYSANSWVELTVWKILKDKNSICQTHHLLYGGYMFQPFISSSPGFLWNQVNECCVHVGIPTMLSISRNVTYLTIKYVEKLQEALRK